MIDVSPKITTLRSAKAEGILSARPEIIERIRNRTVPKGDVLEVARAAGIAAAKRTADWIVFCHPIPLDWVGVSFEIGRDHIKVSAEVRTVWKTGVEMEAITAVSAALLNMYDMLKPLDDALALGDIKVVAKAGGKSDFTAAAATPLNAAVLVIAAENAPAQKTVEAGEIVQAFLQKQAVIVKTYERCAAEPETISNRLTALADLERFDLICTVGGTGFGPTDCVPAATQAVIEQETPGIAETIRRYRGIRTPEALFAREISGLRNKSLILNLPGTAQEAQACLQALFPGLLQGMRVLRREDLG